MEGVESNDRRYLTQPAVRTKLPRYLMADATLSTPLKYKAGLGSVGVCGCCCQLSDKSALRCVIVWMVTVAIVVLAALIIEITTRQSTIQSGDVVSDHVNCTNIAVRVLQSGGNAVDAAIAGSVCLTATLPQLASLGGGGVMLIHKHRINKTRIIDFREISPSGLQSDRYMASPEIGATGRTSIGTPGVLAGLRVAMEKYGSQTVNLHCCSWYDLLSPTVQLLDYGFDTDPWLMTYLARHDSLSPELRTFLRNGGYSRPNGKFSKQLVESLKQIYQNHTAFYDGPLGSKLAGELEGQISENDLTSYQVEELDPLIQHVGGYRVYAAPPPFLGYESLALLNALEWLHNEDSVDSVEKAIGKTDVINANGDSEDALERTREMDRLNEKMNIAIKNILAEPVPFGFPKQKDEGKESLGNRDNQELLARVGDIISKQGAGRWFSERKEYGDFSPDIKSPFIEQGASILVMDLEDNYVSVVLSNGGYFGSEIFAKGILMNNALAQFNRNSSVEATGGNLPRPSVRPVSSATPLLAINGKETCGSRFLLAGVGPLELAQVIGPVILSQLPDLTVAVGQSRLVPQPADESVRMEKSHLPPQQLSGTGDPVQGHAVLALDKTKDTVYGVADDRAGDISGKWTSVEDID